MNRRILSFIVLVVAAGCMTVEPDPINEYPYPTSQRPPGKASAASATKGLWYGADGQPLSMAYSDGITRPAAADANAPKSWTNPPQRTTVASRNNGSSTPATATAKPSSAPTSAAKSTKKDDILVKASYTEPKSTNEKTTRIAASAKSGAAKTPAEAPSPPVNLGLLRLTNGKRITIRYEVKDPAAVGVADLEIWGTTDLRTWKKYDVASRSSSSLMVDVKDEGLYGFTVLARAKGDATRNQPPVGEPPQMWVAIDLTKPVVQLLGVDMKGKGQSASLVVRWNAKDRNLGARPITLLYAERAEGPWLPFAANVENNGHYEWALPAHAAADMCVRVQATDLMGNIGLAQTSMLHIPGRTTINASLTGPELGKPTGLTGSASNRPPRPTVSILSVDGQ